MRGEKSELAEEGVSRMGKRAAEAQRRVLKAAFAAMRETAALDGAIGGSGGRLGVGWRWAREDGIRNV